METTNSMAKHKTSTQAPQAPVTEPSILDQLEEMAALDSKREAIAQAIAERRPKALVALPAQFGYESMEAFVAACLEADKSVRKAAKAKQAKGKSAKAVKQAKAAKQPRAPKEPKEEDKKPITRVKITDAIRAQVKTLVDAGSTQKEIVAILGISVPSVQNVKRLLGLTRTRGGDSEAPVESSTEAPVEAAAEAPSEPAPAPEGSV